MVILSDLSEVLIMGLYDLEKIIAKHYGEAVGEAFLARRRSIYEDTFIEVLRGRCSEDAYWQKFMEEGEWPFNVEDIKRCVSENLKIVVPGTIELYKNIVAYPSSFDKEARIMQGRPEIFIVSDHLAERVPELKGYHPDLFEMVSREYWSCDTGSLKGDSGFFTRFLEEFNLKAKECLFIDDYERNIGIAEEAGIEAIQFKSAEQLKADMEKLGFRFSE